MTATMTLSEFLAQLKRGEPTPLPKCEEWNAMIARISVPGSIAEVTGETYDYFLEVLPPRWMGMGAGFAFGEGDEAIRIFWTANTSVGRLYFCRQLNAAENVQFCRLARIGVTSG
jgi:hypothetical protein